MVLLKAVSREGVFFVKMPMFLGLRPMPEIFSTYFFLQTSIPAAGSELIQGP